ncbi:hypothetical protein E4U42_007506 [Claviceps africana]|uniref:Uncharacterized protein n=1 Tax=Claviceps africana TaxID=83212 RepID=A0A8K0J6R5_9HYPO|nr:hypothetical protein E4U42_007506 [Claviceps africana]
MLVARPPRTQLSRGIGASLLLLLLLLLLLSARTSSQRASPGKQHAQSRAKDPGLEFPKDPVPRRYFAALSRYPAQNIKGNATTRFAFATLYCSRDSDPRDPYFEATQSIVWRLLWSDYRSRYPVVVFVCPFIPSFPRRVLMGQGAVVREIGLLDGIIPDEAISTRRWVDVLSKLNLWRQVEWERIAFLDSDAFPVRNMDDVFDVVPQQQCRREALDAQDGAVVGDTKRGDDMCSYVYAGVAQFSVDNINAGMLVLKPNLDMHAKLLRAARKTEDYDVTDMEQGVLKSRNAFAADGPFPVHRLPPVWNALPEYYIRYMADRAETTEGPIRVLHAKMWNRLWGSWNNLTHLNDMWDLDWMKMCRFFDSDDFVRARVTGVYETPLERYLRGQMRGG